MSEKIGTTSNVEPDQKGELSVYDFLYQDVRRVGSFLAQFDSRGHLQQLKQTRGDAGANESSWKDIDSVNAAVAKITTQSAEASTSSYLTSAEWAFDPLWVNAISLLTYLQNHGLLQRKVATARLGQIVLVTGSLSILDLPLLKEMFKNPKTMEKVLKVGSPGGAGNLAKHFPIMELLAIMPFPVQAFLQTEDAKVWAVLNEESLAISASNIFLKYGTELSGEWNILGVLDAMPTKDVVEPKSGDDIRSLLDVMNSFNVLASHIGRPATAHGITPLIIFRRVLAADADA